MTLPWDQYRPADYLRAKPILQGLKSARYQAVRRVFVRRGAVAGDERAVIAHLAGRRVLVTLAFEDEYLIRRHVDLVRRFVRPEVHLVADNSVTDAGAAAICACAEARGLPYVRLPPNPWTAKEASRSHGIAMNWVWHRLLRPAMPAAFGFVDQDMFPLAPDDPFAALAERSFFGDIRTAGERWFLWAGYCFFRTRDVSDLPLDFGQDWFIGLDTGGGNWRCLYRHVDRRTLPQRPIELVPAIARVPIERAYFEVRGTWLHAVGTGGDPALRTAKRAALAARLDAVCA
jgi:hypothetical protein